MRKREFKLSERISGSKLTIKAFADSDKHGNQCLVVECDCGKTVTMRATKLTMKSKEDKNGKTRKPHRSCGCESKRAYSNYLINRASGIRKRVQREIYIAHQEGKTFKQIAIDRSGGKHKIDAPVISAIVRLGYRKYGPAKIGAIPKNSKAKQDLL